MKIHGEEIFQAGQLWNLLFKEDELWAQNPGVAHVLFKTLNPAKLGLDILNVKFYNWLCVFCSRIYSAFSCMITWKDFRSSINYKFENI